MADPAKKGGVRFKMLISLCMIAYNEERVLNGLFRDFSTQDYPHNEIEIVLVDSSSTDNTHKMMTDFKNTDYGFADVIIVECPKKNQAASWNCAIMSAHGDVIIRVDAHARIPRNFVSRNIYNINLGEKVVGGGRPNITSDVSPWRLTLLAAEESLFGSSVASYRRPTAKREYMDSLFHAAYKREVFEAVGGFNETLGRTEDNELHYRIRQAGYKLCCCPDIISYQHTRNRLRDMIKQKFSNGKWIGLTVSSCPQCLSYYHFAPMIFVGLIAVCIAFACFGYLLPLQILLMLYAMFDIVNTVGCFATKTIQPQFIFLPFIFPILHISYGIGTYAGLLKIPFWKRKRNDEYAAKQIEKVKNKVKKNTKIRHQLEQEKAQKEIKKSNNKRGS